MTDKIVTLQQTISKQLSGLSNKDYYGSTTQVQHILRTLDDLNVQLGTNLKLTTHEVVHELELHTPDSKTIKEFIEYIDYEYNHTQVDELINDFDEYVSVMNIDTLDSNYLYI